jgi:hypothetical protein
LLALPVDLERVGLGNREKDSLGEDWKEMQPEQEQEKEMQPEQEQGKE